MDFSSGTPFGSAGGVAKTALSERTSKNSICILCPVASTLIASLRQIAGPAGEEAPPNAPKKSAGVVLRQLGPSRSIRFVSGDPQRQSPRSSEFRETPSPTTIAADRIMTPSSPGSTGPQSWRNVFSSCHRDAAAPKRRARGLRLRGHGGRAAAARKDDSGAISRQRR